MTPRLALVPGEPGGIGPELCVRLAQQRRQDCTLLAFGDAATLGAAADALGLPLRLLVEHEVASQPGDLRLRPVPNAALNAFGKTDPRNARAVIDALTLAADACLRGELDGLVTGPVHKAAINAGGIAYSGTTELLAEHAARPVVMMLANQIVRVALATTHLPLRDVPDAITHVALAQVLRITHAALRRDFGIADPVIAVLGLNPHAGEAGLLGREEIEVIEPVLERLRGEGMQLIGDMPADTLFVPHTLEKGDVALAMYHDQGLPVLKHASFGGGVNVTLGLPIIRTSVDHGTALDLAGTGRADPGSLFVALEQACEMVARAGTAENL